MSVTTAFAQENDATVSEKLGDQEKLNEISEVISPMAQYGEITANNVRLRKDPGLSSTVLMHLHKGYEVTCLYDNEVYKDGIWWKKVIYEGVTGWVDSQYVYEYGR